MIAIGRWGAGTFLLASVLIASAQTAPSDPARLLWRIQQAAANSTYQGTMTVNSAGVVSSSRISHICDGRHRYERIEVLDGQARQLYRHNDRLMTVWPQHRLAVLEREDPAADFPSLPSSAGQRALDNYELRSIGNDRIAGHEAEVLLLKPRDAHRFAQRLWAERKTGLLLRSDVLGPKGELLESSSFIDLAIGGRPSPEIVTGPMKRLEGLRVLRPQVVATQLEAEGWALSRGVPGFALVSCVKRPLDVTAADEPAVQVLQSVFSDGLTHVSVFIEPYDAQRHKPIRTSIGAMNTLMNRQGEWWVTVMGDVPMATVQQFEAMLQRR